MQLMVVGSRCAQESGLPSRNLEKFDAPSTGNDRVLDFMFLTVLSATLKHAGYQTKLMLCLQGLGLGRSVNGDRSVSPCNIIVRLIVHMVRTHGLSSPARLLLGQVFPLHATIKKTVI